MSQTDKELLQWIHDRLARIYNENYDFDYMIKLRKIIGRYGKEEVVLKPEKQIINLHMMQGSDVDMEFSENTDCWRIGKLRFLVENSASGLFFVNEEQETSFKNCRVRENHWHSWQGGECPLPAGLNICFLTRDNQEIKCDDYRTNLFTTWQHGVVGRSDIIAFKVTGVAEGWKYEWMENE